MKLLYLLILILFIPTVFARQEFTFKTGQEVEYKTATIKLEIIGTQGSAQILLNKKPIHLTLNNPVEVENFRITLRESSYNEPEPIDRYAKILFDFLGECTEDIDCQSYECFQSFCENNQCRKLLLSGCPHENECKPQGTVIKTSQLDNFCSTANKWFKRKEIGEYCLFDYECISDACDITCKSRKRIAPSWLLVLIGFLIIFKSLPFILYPHKSKQISQNYFRNFSDQYFRIISLTMLILGIVLIILAL